MATLVPRPPPRLDASSVEAHLRDVCFASSAGSDRIGLEVEVLPVDAGTRSPAPLRGGAGTASLADVLDALAREGGWTVGTTPAGSPSWQLPSEARVSFEPGGQLEYSSPPRISVDEVVEGARSVVRTVVGAARKVGLDASARGFDPWNPADEAPLQVTAPRYRAMAAHYDRIGPWGRRMMRQTAGIHVNVDGGDQPLSRWRVARRVVPSLLAIFANSPRAVGRSTGHRSWRAAQWRRLDPGRTGLPGAGADPVGDYLEFVLAAPAFLLAPEGAPAESFRTWIERGIGRPELEGHLSTLFPEVRPRGYLEIRCIDALPPRWYAVPPVVVAGLLYDPDALAEGEATLPEPEPGALERAGRLGVRDPEVRTTALRVLELALMGAERLGRERVGREALDATREFRERFTRAGRDPGDDPTAGEVS